MSVVLRRHLNQQTRDDRVIQGDIAEEKNTPMLRRYNLLAFVLHTKVKEDCLSKLKYTLFLVKPIGKGNHEGRVENWHRQSEDEPQEFVSISSAILQHREQVHRPGIRRKDIILESREKCS